MHFSFVTAHDTRISGTMVNDIDRMVIGINGPCLLRDFHDTMKSMSTQLSAQQYENGNRKKLCEYNISKRQTMRSDL